MTSTAMAAYGRKRANVADQSGSRLAGSSVEIAELAGVKLAKLVPEIDHTAELVLAITGSSGSA